MLMIIIRKHQKKSKRIVKNTSEEIEWSDNVEKVKEKSNTSTKEVLSVAPAPKSVSPNTDSSKMKVNKGKTQIYWKSISFDLTSTANLSESKSIIEKSDLLVIQNCLNEIAKIDLPSLKINVKTLFEYLPSDAYLLMADMTSVARPIMNVLEAYLVSTFSPKFSPLMSM